MAHMELATGSEALMISPKLVTEVNEGEQRTAKERKRADKSLSVVRSMPDCRRTGANAER